MLGGHDIQQWAPVASTALAALAGTAAWMNVWLSRRHWLDAQRPVLVGQMVDNHDKARIELHIHNAGAGPARGVRFLVMLGDEYVTGYAGPNYGALLKSDELRIIATHLTARTGHAKGVLVCLDGADRVHVSGMDGRHRTERLRGETWEATDPVARFREQHPDVDDASLRKVDAVALRKATQAP